MRREQTRRGRVFCCLAAGLMALLGMGRGYARAEDCRFAAYALHGTSARSSTLGKRRSVSSPTGRQPRLFWTPQRQATWNRMVTDTDPHSEGYRWWHRIQAVADGRAEVTGNQCGEMQALAYQMTGDANYARAAWAIVQPYVTTRTLPITNHNATRILAENYAWVYDWIYPALSVEERGAYVNFLNWVADLCLGHAEYHGGGWGIRTHNANGCIGGYFGAALIAAATADDNPRAGSFLASSISDDGKIIPVGGLDATGVDRTTVRNAIGQYLSAAQGGVWPEGSNYQFAALTPLLEGIEGLWTATGQEHFPEVRASLPSLLRYSVYQLTPDGKDSYQWSDEEKPRCLQMVRRQTLAGEFAGLLEGTPAGPYAQELVLELEASPAEYGGGRCPQPIFYALADPYAPAADWRQESAGGASRFGAWDPHAFYGNGLLLWHDGWGADDAFVGMQAVPRFELDHVDETKFQGDVQIYRRGEWALTHPIGYADISLNGNGANAFLLYGLTCMWARGPIAHEIGSAYAYLAAGTAGSAYRADYYHPPSPFVNEYTRSLLYLPSADRHSDVVIVFDRALAVDPRLLPRWERYDSITQAQVEDALAPKQWAIHAPVVPVVTSGTLSWQTAGGQQVEVDTLLPVAQARTVIDDANYTWPPGMADPPPGEAKYQVRVSPATVQPYDTFLNVVQVFDAGYAASVCAVQSDGGEVQGALVERAEVRGMLALFGAQEGVRTITRGYRAAFTAHTARTQIYLPDLDPSRLWTAFVDGKPVKVRVSAQGVGRLSVKGAGAHLLQIGVRTV